MERPNLCNFTPEQLSYLAVTFAVTFSKEFSRDELLVLSSFFTSVGGTFALIARQEQLIDNLCKPSAKET